MTKPRSSLTVRNKPPRLSGNALSDRQNLTNELSQLEHQHGRLLRERELFSHKLLQTEADLLKTRRKLHAHYVKLSEGLAKR